MTEHFLTPTTPSAGTDRIETPHVGRALLTAKLTDKPVPYGAVYRGILSGAIPAEQMPNGRWTVSRADLPKVAAALGLCTRQPVAA